MEKLILQQGRKEFMARRRRKNRRRRKGRFAFLYKLLAFLAICAAIVVAMALFFKANTIEVSGNSRYSKEEVTSASGIQIGDNLFLLNKYDAAEKIRDALPYVQAVRISRHLPDSLCISVTESDCTAAVEQDGQVWLMGESGKLVDMIEPGSDTPYVKITGVVLTDPKIGEIAACEDEETSQELLELLKMLGSKGMLAQVQEIHMEDPGVITLRYLDAFNVELLWHADLDYKLNYLTAVIEKLEENEKGTIILTRDGEARFIPE